MEPDLLAETVAFDATLADDETHVRMQRFLDLGGQTPEGERRLGELAGELDDRLGGADGDRSGVAERVDGVGFRCL